MTLRGRQLSELKELNFQRCEYFFVIRSSLKESEPELKELSELKELNFQRCEY